MIFALSSLSTGPTIKLTSPILLLLSDGPNEKIQAVIEAGVCQRLIELLMHQSTAVQTPALRTVGNIVTGDDLQTQIIINCNALPCLVRLLESPRKGIRKEVRSGSRH